MTETAAVPEGRTLLPIDKMTLAFIALNLVLLIAGWQYADSPATSLVGYLVCAAMVVAFVLTGPPAQPELGTSKYRSPLQWIHGLFRQGYPLTLLLYFFVQVTEFDNYFFAEPLDPWFAKADLLLFGYLPNQTWIYQSDSFLLSEVLHGAYFIYYLFLAIVPVAIFVSKPQDYGKYVFATMAVFYASALTYAILPVAGGRFDPQIRELTETLRHGPFTKLMAILYQTSTHFGAAFPSTHVSMSLCMAAGTLLFHRRLAPVLVVNGVLVLIATVWCGYHYVVDVFGGIVYFGVIFPLALRYARRFRFPDSGAAGGARRHAPEVRESETTVPNRELGASREPS